MNEIHVTDTMEDGPMNVKDKYTSSVNKKYEWYDNGL